MSTVKEKSMVRDLTHGNTARLLIAFALPFILANLLQTCYTLTDVVIIGRFVGSGGISAVANGGDVMNFFSFLGTGLASGGQIAISQLIGRGRKDMLKHMIGTMLTFILGFGIVLSVLCLPFADVFLRWMRVPTEAFSMAHDYLVVCLFGTFFIFGYNTISSILRGMGDSKRPFLFVAIAACSNVVLDLLFVGVFDMRAFGAALATVTGQAISFCVSLVYLYRRREAFGFDFKIRSFIPDKSCLSAFLKQGVSIALQHSTISFSMLFVSSFINSYGLTASAVTGVGNKLVLAAYVVTNGLSQATSSITGQSFGAGLFKRVREAVRSAFIVGFVFCAALSAAALIFPEQIFALFDNDPEVLRMSHLYVMTLALNYIGAACRAPLIAFLNGIGFASLNFLMGVIDGIVMRICLAILLGLVLDMGVMGFWLGNALAGFTYAVIITPYFLSGKWKKRGLAVNNI